MSIKLIKLQDGPLLLAEESDNEDPLFTNHVRPVICFEDDGVIKLGTFLEVADPNRHFIFNNVEFECYPDEKLEEDYKSFVNDYIQKTE